MDKVCKMTKADLRAFEIRVVLSIAAVGGVVIAALKYLP